MSFGFQESAQEGGVETTNVLFLRAWLVPFSFFLFFFLSFSFLPPKITVSTLHSGYGGCAAQASCKTWSEWLSKTSAMAPEICPTFLRWTGICTGMLFYVQAEYLWHLSLSSRGMPNADSMVQAKTWCWSRRSLRAARANCTQQFSRDGLFF